MRRRTLNLGILAHVDAGKTTLTERLLHLAGVIDEPGSVDSGTTTTDSLDLERRRGITIKAAVVAFPLDGATVNVLDTPGHPDFIAEVERVLGVLDGAVLVLSAVEGVQPQTRILMRALQRLRVPTLLFVNKLDRVGADLDAVVSSIARRLTPDLLVMGAASGLGSRSASWTSYDEGDAGFREQQTEALAEHDDSLLSAFVEGDRLSTATLDSVAASQIRAGLLHPVYAGSAATGAGVVELMRGLAVLVPGLAEHDAAEDDDGPPYGRVFKVERGRAGEKSAYVRLFRGTVTPRSRLELPDGRSGKVTALELFDGGRWVRRDRVAAGQIARLHGLSAVRVGDDVGPSDDRGPTQQFPPPTLEASVTAVRPDQAADLRAALAELADQDPLIRARSDDDGRATVSLYGRVQQEVIGATLADEYGIEVEFADASVLHVERPRATGSAIERFNTPSNPYHATLRIRIAPGPPGSGLTFRVTAPTRGLPLFLFGSAETFAAAIRGYVEQALDRGQHGWPVTDCRVTVTEVDYTSADGPPARRGPLPTASDYRHLTPMVVVQALHRAGTRVCEPMLQVSIEMPRPYAPVLQRLLGRWGCELTGQRVDGELTVLESRVPAARLHELQRSLPDLTAGEGVLESRFDGYRPVRGAPPVRSGMSVPGARLTP